jgi:NAD(P)H-quinone oxidoreductase subunit K
MNLSGIDEPETNYQMMNPIHRPEIPQQLSENVILANVNDLYNWARLSSLYPLMFGTACCFIEFAATLGSRMDLDRFGVFPRMSPRQADLIITAGTITMKMAPALVRLYEQMPEPKYVMAMGACTISGGMFSADSPTAVRGVDKLIPVDVYIAGCPPRPEAVFDAVVKLRKKIANENLQERDKSVQTHRYYSITHQMKPVPPILTGQYLETQSRQAPPKELEQSLGMPFIAQQPVKEGAEAEMRART